MNHEIEPAGSRRSELILRRIQQQEFRLTVGNLDAAGLECAFVGPTERPVATRTVRPECRLDSDPGITYANMAFSYSASQLNNSNGNPVQGVTGTYSVWVDENIIYYVPKQKILGGYFMPYIDLNWASGGWWLT